VNERAAFTRAICENPADDTVRLVYADWLEEHGEPERAEFVRVQVEIANRGLIYCQRALPSGLTAYHLLDWHRFTKNCRCEGCSLRRREYKASRRFCVWDWCDGIPRGARNVYRRGFVSQISLPCAAFLTHAAAIFAAHPVTEVTLTDKRPLELDLSEPYANWPLTVRWFRGAEHTVGDPEVLPSETLPAEIFDFLPDSETYRTNPAFFNKGYMGDYESEPIALAAASVACVAYGRKLVNLPPLPALSEAS
jgi:uncharacterized protein (TIGR02996 family)